MAGPIGGGGGTAGGSGSMRSSTGPATSTSSGSSRPSGSGGSGSSTRASEALLRAVGKHGQEEVTMASSFRAGGICLAACVAVAAVWCARLNESKAVERWLAEALSRRIGEGDNTEAASAMLALLELGLRGAALGLLLLGLGYLAAGAYALVRAAEPAPELEGLTDAQRRLLGLDPVVRRGGKPAATASPAAAAAMGSSSGGSGRPTPIAGVGSGPLYLSPPSAFASSLGRPPLGSGSSGSGRRRAYGRSRGVAGAALSFGGGADEQVQGFLEVRRSVDHVRARWGRRLVLSGPVQSAPVVMTYTPSIPYIRRNTGRRCSSPPPPPLLRGPTPRTPPAPAVPRAAGLAAGGMGSMCRRRPFPACTPCCPW